MLRWVHCRLHVFELMADYSICDSLIDSEAKSNFLELDRADLLETSRRDSWAYRALWEGREAKYYSSDAYSLGTRPIEFLLHSLQK